MRVFNSPTPPPTCFFCLTSLSKQPRNPRSFKCPECSCWNRYDETGEIISDEPAMHDESLNTRSFAKRASPNKNRLPPAYKKSPFCHTCLTNQTLLTNLLSNYLPDPEDPTYASRVAEMSAYTTALQARYPPVCKDCQPSIDEELKEKEHMARTTALGGWLKRSQHVGARRFEEQQRARPLITSWRLRGFLWVVTTIIFVAIDLAKILQYNPEHVWLATLLPLLAFLSLLWTFWDPTWFSTLHLRLQGRSFTVAGRNRFIACQMILWLDRLTTGMLFSLSYKDSLPSFATPYAVRCWYTAGLAIEILLTAFSLATIKVKQPHKVRLIEPRNVTGDFSRSSTPAPSFPSPDPALAGLSLGPSSSRMPVFGKPSFPSPMPNGARIGDEDMMDWTPDHSPTKPEQSSDNWLRPQRFFPPEKSTGLEDLFAQATTLDTDHGKMGATFGQKERRLKELNGQKYTARAWEVGVFCTIAVVIAVMIGVVIRRF